jgi:hypothetical protein
LLKIFSRFLRTLSFICSQDSIARDGETVSRGEGGRTERGGRNEGRSEGRTVSEGSSEIGAALARRPAPPPRGVQELTE